MNLRTWLRALKIRRARKDAPPFTRDELAELIAEVRRPNGFGS
jgi:hypothetical protein